MAVKVQFEVGHTSKLKSKKTVEGFTHDWEVYVKGVQQADISAFVEKVVFILHESFPKPKRVCKEPPYAVQESGYAGFIIQVDIYFRNKDEPKMSFSYDLDLQTSGPPHHRYDINNHIFQNPSEEFRQKLLRGGGIPVTGVMGPNAALGSNVDMHKNSPAEKKHKSRPEDSKADSFAKLFGPPIKSAPPANVLGSGGVVGSGIGMPGTGTGAYAIAGNSKHSPEAKSVHQHLSNPVNSNMQLPKEKSSKDKDKSSSSSKDRSEKKEKHHKLQAGTSPHKDGKTESKKSDGKHEKRDRNEEKSSKKDKNRDKDRDRERDKLASSLNANTLANNNKRPSTPKSSRDLSPMKNAGVPGSGANSLGNSSTSGSQRPSSSQSGKLEEIKSSSKSKESSGDSKSKDPKQKESSSSSSGKKSKKDKKDRERDKERRHEEKEKQRQLDASSKASKEEHKSLAPPINANPGSSDVKPVKSSSTAITQAEAKKMDKTLKQDATKSMEKSTILQASPMLTNNQSTAPVPSSTNDVKKSSSSSNPPEKDKRSHKHKKKDKNKEKEKERDRDKERDKDKEREREKDKEKDKEKDRDREKEKDREMRKDKEAKEKLSEEKHMENFSLPPPLLSSTGVPANNNSPRVIEETPSINSTPTSTTSTTTSSSSKSSKNKEKKSKDKAKEDKVKRKSNEMDSIESKSKQAKSSLTSNPSSSSTSAAPSATPLASAANPMPSANSNAASNVNTTNSSRFDLSDNDSVSSVALEPAAPATTNSNTGQPNSSQSGRQMPLSHSDSSNSSFPELTMPQKPPLKANNQPTVTLPPPNKDAPPKSNKLAKDKPAAVDKSAKEEEKERKRRRNSQVNTFIEPPLKQRKDQTKSMREKSKSPSLRNSNAKTSISDPPTTFLQPGASPSSTAAAAPLPPPAATAHSPAFSATEAVGNATSATANAATCNSNATTPTNNNNSLVAPHQLPVEYLTELQELHQKIMTLQDNEDLQHVVELIAATGCYEITTKTFDFDLCKLDRGTVQRLQEFFATSVS